MPIVDDFKVPNSAQELDVTEGSDLFVLYLSSTDPTTKEPWCSDVRNALPLLNKLFSTESSPAVHYVYVGQRPEYKTPGNFFRTNWDIQFVPTLVRYRREGDAVKEVGRLVEEQLLDEKKIDTLIA